jgi:hypothetical protein
LERAQELRDMLEHVDADHRGRIDHLLSAVELLAYEKVPLWKWTRRLSDWWYGSRVERAWSYLHEAELLFVEHADERGMEVALDNAVEYALTLPMDDPMRVRFDAYVQSLAKTSPNGGKAVEPAATSAAPVPEPAP